MARNLLTLVGLQRHHASEDSRPASRDRRSRDREQVFALAQHQRELLESFSAEYRPRALRLVLDTALGYGFFSCWLEVFQDHADFCNKLIDRMPGTARNCFDGSGRTRPRPGGRC